MTERTKPEDLGPYEHVFSDDCHECALCGWTMPEQLPAGTPYGRGARTISRSATRHPTEAKYTWLADRGSQFVVEDQTHAGWIDWNAATAPLCSPDAAGKRHRERFRLLVLQKIPPDTVMTCDNCDGPETGCQSAFDAYNTDGDCLESK